MKRILFKFGGLIMKLVALLFGLSFLGGIGVIISQFFDRTLGEWYEVLIVVILTVICGLVANRCFAAADWFKKRMNE